MKLGWVRHYNVMKDHVNYLEKDTDAAIFCRKRHEVVAVDTSECLKCPYFGGFGQGGCHECVWQDISPNGPDDSDFDGISKVIPFEDRYKELMRVSKLIDKGIISKGISSTSR